MTTTPEPVDAMRAAYAEADKATVLANRAAEAYLGETETDLRHVAERWLMAASRLAAVVQAEQSVGIREVLTSLAADVKRIADAYVDATVDAASRMRHEAEDEDRRLARAQRAAENAKRSYDALRAEVEQIAADAEVDSIVVYREIPGRLRRALEGGEPRG